MRGEEEDMIGSSCDRYIKRMITKTQATAFNSNFSPACGGNQNGTNVINTITTAGTIAMALNIGELRRKFK